MSVLGSFPNVTSVHNLTVTHAAPQASSYQIKGVVKVGGFVASRRVVVLNRADLSYIRSGVSLADGTFLFKRMPYQIPGDFYVVIAFDDNQNFNAETIDLVQNIGISGV